MAKQLCTGMYHATHVPGAILVVATGWHSTGGYGVWLEPERAPHHVALYHEVPELATDVLAAFTVATTISDPNNSVQVIWVHDAGGVRAVKVEPAYDVRTCGGGEIPTPLLRGGDGPFPTPSKMEEARNALKTGECGAWYAWVDKMPGPGSAPRLRVIGTCVFPTTGWSVVLRRAVPPGTNQNILLLDKIVTPPSGIVLQVITRVDVRYEEIPDSEYDEVTIRPGPTIPVRIVQ